MPVAAARSAVRTLLTGDPDGAAPWVRAIGEPGDDGWFGPGSTIWAVHADAATLVGGVRALLVQAMHPTVLAGFDQHSGYREDPESRLQRTAAFVTVTTFGTVAAGRAGLRAGAAGARAGPRPDARRARPYDAGDPDLLGWVHLALADSLAESVRRLGRTAFDLDRYLADMAVVGRAARRRPRAARPGRAARPPGTTTCRSSPSRPPRRRRPPVPARPAAPAAGARCPTGWWPRRRSPRSRRTCARC